MKEGGCSPLDLMNDLTFMLFLISLQDETGNPAEEESTSHPFTASPDRATDVLLNV